MNLPSIGFLKNETVRRCTDSRSPTLFPDKIQCFVEDILYYASSSIDLRKTKWLNF
jgi:hypothetical protein